MKRAIRPDVTERYYKALFEISHKYSTPEHSEHIKIILKRYGVSRVVSTKIMRQCLDKVKISIYVWKQSVIVSQKMALEFHLYANSTSTKWQRNANKGLKKFQERQIQQTQSITYIRNFKDDELVAELRRRGYEVKASKTVTIIHEL